MPPGADSSASRAGVQVGDQVELAGLLLERQLGQQQVDPLLDGEGGVEPGAARCASVSGLHATSTSIASASGVEQPAQVVGWHGDARLCGRGCRAGTRRARVPPTVTAA